jgi:WD40 repeat protein
MDSIITNLSNIKFANGNTEKNTSQNSEKENLNKPSLEDNKQKLNNLKEYLCNQLEVKLNPILSKNELSIESFKDQFNKFLTNFVHNQVPENIKDSTIKSDNNKLLNKQKNKKSITLIKTVKNHTGGMFFHPREIIDDEILLTGGRDGIIKFWDFRNKKCELINQVDIGTQWITSLKYDNKYSHIYCSTYSKYLLIFDYNIKNNILTHLKTYQMEGLHFIYGFDIINSDNFSLLACSGYSELPESVFIYSNSSGCKINYVLNQAIIPLEKVDYITNKSKENYSKSLKFHDNFLIIGLQNGIIEIYKLEEFDKTAIFLYHLNLSVTDFVFQIQVFNFNGISTLIASNANCLYSLNFNENEYKLNIKKTFCGAIHDFYYLKKNLSEKKNIFIKLKTGLVVLYDIQNDETLEDIDESKKKGLYDHCLIACEKENLLFSCRDNDILIYKY